MFEKIGDSLRADRFMPYAPAKPVVDVIRRFRERGLPEILSRQELHRLGAAEGNSDRIQKTLQFLDLIDAEGRRTELFDRIGKASTAEYEGTVAEVVRAAYAPILAIVDPAVDTDIAVNDAFRHYEPAGQRRQMVSLFLALCREAGIVSGGPLDRKPRAKRENVTTRPPRAVVPNGRTATTERREEAPPDVPVGPDYRLLSALIQQLPREGRWPSDRRERWLQAFTANIDLLIEVEDKR